MYCPQDKASHQELSYGPITSSFWARYMGATPRASAAQEMLRGGGKKEP